MKAEELRIGLYFNVPRADQSPFRIDVIEHLSNNYAKVGMNFQKYEFPIDSGNFINGHPLTWELKDLEPIPISEEMLFKFGFEKSFGDYIAQDGFFTLKRDVDQFFYRDYLPISPSIDYLHQLQNLYYCLVGKELDVNL